MSLAARLFADGFEREHGCTLAEWRRELPGAVGGHRLHLLHDTASGGQARVDLVGAADTDTGADAGTDTVTDLGANVSTAPHAPSLQLQWTVLPPRQIALVRLPRLHVVYRFQHCSARQRSAFMAHFDLFLQRGGG